MRYSIYLFIYLCHDSSRLEVYQMEIESDIIMPKLFLLQTFCAISYRSTVLSFRIGQNAWIYRYIVDQTKTFKGQKLGDGALLEKISALAREGDRNSRKEIT